MDINESTMSSNHNCLNFCNRRSKKLIGGNLFGSVFLHSISRLIHH